MRADNYLYKVVDQPSDLHAFFLITSYKSSIYSLLGIFTFSDQFVHVELNVYSC